MAYKGTHACVSMSNIYITCKVTVKANSTLKSSKVEFNFRTFDTGPGGHS